jgi:hypothetical protein
MNLSRYFHELQDGYLSEIEDLRLDSEGRDVLDRRLRDKRQGFAAVVSMMDTDPLMLAPALHGAFHMPPGRLPAIEDLLGCEPDELPSWGELSRQVEVASWARPLVERALEEEAGPAFLATVVGLEYLLSRQRIDAGPMADPEAEGAARRERDDGDDRDEGEGDDDVEGLADDFLEQQGFDRRNEP